MGGGGGGGVWGGGGGGGWCLSPRFSSRWANHLLSSRTGALFWCILFTESLLMVMIHPHEGLAAGNLLQGERLRHVKRRLETLGQCSQPNAPSNRGFVPSSDWLSLPPSS